MCMYVYIYIYIYVYIHICIAVLTPCRAASIGAAQRDPNPRSLILKIASNL